MPETFTADAWERIWSTLDERTKADIRAKARWEHITVSAALKWMRPDLWQTLVESHANL